MSRFPTIAIFITAALLLNAPHASAAVFAGWELLGSTQTNRTDAPSFQTGLTASNLTIAPTLVNETTFQSSSQTLSGNLWPTVTSPDLSKYFELTATPLAGQQLTFDYLQMPLWHQTQAGDTGPVLWQVRWSGDNYASAIGSAANIGSADFSAPATVQFDLTSLPSVSSAATFRVYGYGAANSSGSGGLHVTSALVYLQGEVVPEPAGAALLATGGIVVLARRNRSRQGKVPSEGHRLG